MQNAKNRHYIQNERLPVGQSQWLQETFGALWFTVSWWTYSMYVNKNSVFLLPEEAAPLISQYFYVRRVKLTLQSNMFKIQWIDISEKQPLTVWVFFFNGESAKFCATVTWCDENSALELFLIFKKSSRDKFEVDWMKALGQVC